MNNHYSYTESGTIGGILALICKIDFLFLGDIGKSFLVGIAGAAGGWFFNYLRKKYSK